jgi:hypothetical protein
MKEHMAFLVPKFNLPVRDPITKAILLPEGEEKPLFGKEGRYWRRRINEGCVEIKIKKVEKYIRPQKTNKER